MSVANGIGRYFSLTSALPAIGLVLWTYALVQSHSATGRPQLAELGDAFSPSIAKGAGLVLAVILVALFMHPLQFGMTQLFEGYWGPRRLPLILSAVRSNFYRRRIRWLERLTDEHERAILAGAGINPQDPNELSDDERVRLSLTLQTRPGDPIMLDVIGRAEAIRKRAEFPERDDRIMPTRLGNALRRLEDAAGTQYGIDAITTAPHFALVAKPEHARYSEDSQQLMDTSLRLCVVSLIATIETILMLLTDGPWLFLALVPYSLAYLAYRGCVSAARGHGTAIATVIDLNRFALYDSLNVRRPGSLREERELNQTLMAVLQGTPVNLRYKLEPERSSMRED